MCGSSPIIRRFKQSEFCTVLSLGIGRGESNSQEARGLSPADLTASERQSHNSRTWHRQRSQRHDNRGWGIPILFALNKLQPVGSSAWGRNLVRTQFDVEYRFYRSIRRGVSRTAPIFGNSAGMRTPLGAVENGPVQTNGATEPFQVLKSKRSAVYPRVNTNRQVSEDATWLAMLRPRFHFFFGIPSSLFCSPTTGG